MRTSRRRTDLRGFSLMDAVVGIVLLCIIAVALGSTWPTLLALGNRQTERVMELGRAIDAFALERNL